MEEEDGGGGELRIDETTSTNMPEDQSMDDVDLRMEKGEVIYAKVTPRPLHQKTQSLFARLLTAIFGYDDEKK